MFGIKTKRILHIHYTVGQGFSNFFSDGTFLHYFKRRGTLS